MNGEAIYGFFEKTFGLSMTSKRINFTERKYLSCHIKTLSDFIIAACSLCTKKDASKEKMMGYCQRLGIM